MDNQLIFDNSEQAGFRLNTLQLCNWGVLQNDKIFTFDFSNKSTLLTGRNGSGKTTIVDAIITLMVPKRYRLYNQSSSGNTKDRERDEESYVLGAYGTSSDESSHSGKTKHLRDKNCISIINGIFSNEITKQAISLMQVRYFSNSELVAYECITEKSLLIEDIYGILQKEHAKLDREKKWRQILKNKCGTDFWDSDGFSKYTARFKNLFGLKEDNENKSLKLFAQIVGMKELGNLNEFIRQKMIEGVDVDTQFENLHNNFLTLIQCENEIAKTKCQLELLKPIIETGRKIEESEKRKEKLTHDQNTVPVWYSKSAIEILSNEINEKTREKNSIENQNIEIKSTIENLSNDIETLSNNSGFQIVREKERQIEDREKDKEKIQKARNIYEQNLKNFNFTTPHSDAEFSQLSKKIEQKKCEIKDAREQLHKKEVNATIERKKLNDLLEELSAELQSLGSRNSNIPLKNIEIRKQILENTSLSENEVPFIGELIQVKDEEKLWNYAIERLLHNLALTLLVTEQNYQKVTEYVKSHNLNGRIVYLRVGMQLEAELPSYSSDTVLGKISVKKGHPLSTWIERHIFEKWNYICSDDFNTISKNDKVVTSSGLIKNGFKHEKDDSEKIRQNFHNVLGWNNLEKRKTISSQIGDINTKIDNLNKETEEINDIFQDLENKNDSAKKVLEYNSFSEIDIDSVAIEIQRMIEEKNRLAKENNVEELERQINEKRAKKGQLEAEAETLQISIGRLEATIALKEKSLGTNQNAWQEFLKIRDERELQSDIQKLKIDYKINEIFLIEKVSSEQTRINAQIKNALTQETNTNNSLIGHLKDYMRDIRSPKDEYKRKYGDWTTQFSDLLEGREYLADWNKCYERLVKDELPKYQEKFKKYLHQNLNADIIRFKNFIDTGNQEIRNAIKNLNENLKTIPYGDTPKTYLQLKISDSKDQKLVEFNRMLKNAIPNAAGYDSEEAEEKAFRRIKDFIDFVKENERNRKYILDLRNWHTFAASELKYEDNSEFNYHSDSNSLSGGEKAKLTYTILASAIAYQFGINDSTTRSLRFVIVDEVFSKSDSINAQYAMQLFKQLDLQVMIVTPLDKLNIAEEYISSVHQVQKIGDSSRILSLTMERFKELKAQTEGNVND
ncbi:AAA family ATPase [Candidatus Saccharibacteria bacterium]|nr:AAA family ATPase [Candidatus Saccharibacteria bacterium]